MTVKACCPGVLFVYVDKCGFVLVDGKTDESFAPALSEAERGEEEHLDFLSLDADESDGRVVVISDEQGFYFF